MRTDAALSQDCGATFLVSSSSYLEQHLKHAIETVEAHSPVEPIGIGHDVTRHCKRVVTITDAEQLGGAITEQQRPLFVEVDA